MNEKELEEMVREADKDKDGLINYEGKIALIAMYPLVRG